MKKILIVLALLTGWHSTGVNAVTQEDMENIVKGIVKVVESKKGYVVFDYKEVRMALISDVSHDRMRIITPITKYSSLNLEQIGKIMDSNFHNALDARYASSNDVLYSAFIHPMSPLSQEQLTDALDQVATLALTFGTSYSSGQLSYVGK
ncbi:MAG TPA: hypothetical protein ENJ87_09065 [Gammaproteobacteria bacterium]|nr:hypothetical protein [Gammaproteobacteria bacterium]